MLEPQIVVGDFAQQVCWAVCRETIRNMSLGFQVFNFRCCDVTWVFSLSRFLAFFNHSWKDGVWKCEHESEKFGRNITSEILRSVPGPISPRTAANPGKSTIWRKKRCPQIPLMHNLSFFRTCYGFNFLCNLQHTLDATLLTISLQFPTRSRCCALNSSL